MSSRKQSKANRLNSRKSTGPKTEEGKRSSSRNAIKHRMTARQFFIETDEDRRLLDQFLDDHLEHYDLGDNPTAKYLVSLLSVSFMQMRQTLRLQTTFLDASRKWTDKDGIQRSKLLREVFPRHLNFVEKTNRYQSHWSRQFHQVFQKLEAIRHESLTHLKAEEERCSCRNTRSTRPSRKPAIQQSQGLRRHTVIKDDSLGAPIM